MVDNNHFRSNPVGTTIYIIASIPKLIPELALE